MKNFLEFLTEERSETLTVLRVGNRSKTIDNRNAGNVEGIISFIDQQDRRGIGTGDTITAYVVKVTGGFGPYEALQGGSSVNSTGKSRHVGKVGRSVPDNKNWPVYWYSFPAGSNFKLIRVGKSISMSDLNKQVLKMKIDNGFGNPHNQLGGLGYVQQKEVIEKAFGIK